MAKRDRDEEILIRTTSRVQAPIATLLAPSTDELRGGFPAVSGTSAGRSSSTERMAIMLDHISDGYAEIDSQWRIVYINVRAEKLLRPKQESARQLLGGSLWRAFPELVGSPFETACQSALNSGHASQFDWVDPDSLRACRVRVTPLSNSVAIFLQEIATSANQPRDLRQDDTYMRALLEAIPHPAWIAQADGVAVWFNQRWYDYTGTTPAQVAMTGWEPLHEPASLPNIKQHWNDAVRDSTPFEMEYLIRGADGHFRWFLTRASPIADGVAPAALWLGTSTDIDQARRAKDALRDESAVLELLNATGAALTSSRDLRSMLQQVTDAATRISGARYGAFVYNSANHDAPALALDVHSGAASAQFAQLGQASAAAMRAAGPAAAPAAVASSAFPAPVATELRPMTSTASEKPQRGTLPVRISDLSAEVRKVSLDQRDTLDKLGSFGHAAESPTVRSYLALPVRSRSGTLLGQLLFGHPEPGMFSARSERLLAGIAAQAAVAIDNSRLYHAAQQAAEERKVLLDSERRARAEAERTNQLKDEFLATLSHELRTPLSAILGWAQVLRRGTRDEADLHRGLQTIERNARAQAQLIEDLLDMSRITSGKVVLDMATLAPSNVIEAALEAAGPAAAAKNIRLEKHIDLSAGFISGDAGRLQQVFWNLLSNAIKFTPRDGTVTVTVRAAAAAGLVEFCISDTGVGIQADFLAYVFERFRQADSSTTRRHGGLGLGLSIVKHLVEQHGGEVHADSAGEDHGASFTVQLPILAAPGSPAPQLLRATLHMPAMPPVTNALSMPDLTGLKVLVVDDDPDARDLLKRILNDCNADVSIAANARQALALFADAPPGLLISDIGMPGTDGYQLLAQVRALTAAQGGNVNAIALTAFAHSEDQTRVLAAGFQAHITKPVEPSRLAAAVSSIMIAGK